METNFSQIITFNISEAVLSELESKKDLKIKDINDKDGYILVDKTRKEAKMLKVQVETRRKELKADSLTLGRLIDSGAKEYSERLIEVEKTLEIEQKRIDDEKARIKFLKEQETKLPERKIRLAEFGVEVADEILLEILDIDFQTKIQSLIQERQDKIAEEQQRERERLEDEAEKLKNELENERRKIAEEKNKLDEEKNKISREKELQEARENAKKEAIEEQRKQDELKKLQEFEEERKRKENEEKDKSFQNWKLEHNYNEKTDIIKQNGINHILYREISQFIFNIENNAN